MLLKDFIREGTGSLESLYPAKEAKSIVLMLCESRLGTRSYTHIVEPEYLIKPKMLAPLKADMERLKSGEPVQYVIGHADFCGLVFKVSEDVLIPRPETELMCREAIKIISRIKRMREAYGKSAKPVRVLDLCTGSGCIAWTLALSVPGIEVVGTDISEKAIMVAANQDFSVKLRETGAIVPHFVISDVLDTDQAFEYEGFDLVISNPPYIMESEKTAMRTNVLDYEPSTALFVPDEDPLLFYKAIARWSARLLGDEGKGMTEINERLGRETEAVFAEAGFPTTETVKDFYDKNRFVFYSR